MRAGEYAKDRVPVISHALDIPERLKEIDPGYFVMLNTRTQKYEIHHGVGENTLECVLPYDELDERAVRHARKHRMERLDALIMEMEEHNRRLEEGAQRDFLNEAGARTKEAVKYLQNNSRTDEIPKELMRR